MNRLKRAVSVVALVFAFVVVGRTGQRSLAEGSIDGQSSGDREKPAEEVYKNIQVLKGMAASQLEGAMLFMSASLGVGCTYCHAGEWESDEKPAKKATRSMILLTQNINRDGFGGSRSVSCNTCHRGQFNTDPVPALMDESSSESSKSIASPKPPAKMPAAADVIAKYTEAIGGAAAIRKLASRVSQGTQTTQNAGEPPASSPVEIQQTSDGKFLSVTGQSPAATYVGFDGRQGWRMTNAGAADLAGDELARVKRDADFFKFLNIAEAYPQMRALGTERVRGRDAYKIGATSRDDSRETLYFDMQNGLLIRRSSNFRTVFGSIPEAMDFDDYRAVAGVKLPFTVRWSRAPFGYTLKFSKVKVNVPVRESVFKRPG